MEHRLLHLMRLLLVISCFTQVLTSLPRPHVPQNNCPQFCTCPYNGPVSCSIPDTSNTFVNCSWLPDMSSLKESLHLSLAPTLLDYLSCLSSSDELEVSLAVRDADLGIWGPFEQGHSLDLVTTLDLSHGHLEELPDSAFGNFHRLRSLDLSNNKLHMLRKESFQGLSQLVHLDASYNSLVDLDVHAFENLIELETLDLSANKVTEFSTQHLWALQFLSKLKLDFNELKYFVIVDKKEQNSTSSSFLTKLSLDLSHNPLDCSCGLENLLDLVRHREVSLIDPNSTVCQSPSSLLGRGIMNLTSTLLPCSVPSDVVSYPSQARDVLLKTSITLECRAEGYPSPSVMWITPWGDKFVNSVAPSVISFSGFPLSDQFLTYKEYGDSVSQYVSSITVTKDNDLVISKFRGGLAGNFKCLVFNPAGNKSENISLTVVSMVKDVYMSSLFIGGYCASGFLIIGFIVGFFKMIIVKISRKACFNAPVFSTAASIEPSAFASSAGSIIYDSDKPDSLPPPSMTPVSISSPFSESPLKSSSPDGTQSPYGWRSHNILETLDEAKERLRFGVGRKMEVVKRNVQSFKESGSLYVHNIMESGSSAAIRMKQGVALGVETVKCHVQSIKELCGTGDMGMQTISMVSVETNIDTHERKNIVKQITFV